MLAAWDEALRRLHRPKRSAVGGLFSRFARVTRPPRSARHGINRLAFDVGRYGLPIGVGYLAGQQLGLWGGKSGDQTAANMARSHLPSGVPIPSGRGSMVPEYMQFSDSSPLVRSRGSA